MGVNSDELVFNPFSTNLGSIPFIRIHSWYHWLQDLVSVSGCVFPEWYEHALFIVHIDGPGVEDMPDHLFSIGTEMVLMCDKDYIFPDGSSTKSLYCDSEFDPEIEAFVVKWRPDLEQCSLSFAYWLQKNKISRSEESFR